MAVLAIRTHHDDLLGVVAPLAVAMSRSTALVVDLDREGIALPGTRTLADLVADGPTMAELVPARAGIACLPNGGIGSEAAMEVLTALGKGWPNVVVRVRTEPEALRTLHVIPVVPRMEPGADATVWVHTGLMDIGVDGPVVRGSTRSAICAALAGRTMRGRWLRSWSHVWELGWR